MTWPEIVLWAVLLAPSLVLLFKTRRFVKKYRHLEYRGKR